MLIDGRVLRDERIDIRDSYQHPRLTGRQPLSYLNLIEITRGIVIDRRPELIAQIANRSSRRHLWRVRCQLRKLLPNLRREFRLKAVLQHGLLGCRLKVEVGYM